MCVCVCVSYVCLCLRARVCINQTEEGLLDIFELLMRDGSRGVKNVLNVLLNDFLGVLREHDCSATEW